MTARDPTRDTMRGITLLEMSFVNICSVPWTNHAGYIDQPAYADLVFPCFAFLAGMSKTPPRRSVTLVGLGVSLNVLSAFLNNEPIRMLGVLQRLGIASGIANSVPNAGVLISLWYAVSLSLGNAVNPFAHPALPQADPANTAQTRIDHIFVGDRIYTPTYDPEGLLGSLTTAISMLVGRQMVHMLAVPKLVVASSMIISGEALHVYLPKYAPISKSLWTPSFVLVTSGITIFKLVLVEQALPFLPDPVTSVLQALGQRSLEIYLFSAIVELCLQNGGHKSVWFVVMAKLEPFFGRTFADLSMSFTFTATMALTAVLLVRSKLRLF